MPRKGQFKPSPEVGSRFGKLLVIGHSEPISEGKNARAATSICQCECGKVFVIRDYVLRRPNTKSCGCTRKHGNARRGSNRSRTYNLWQNMLSRVKRDPHYVNVSVCKEWLESYEQFLSDMGECPDQLTLDRINPLGNYEPGNCRWATVKQQQNNRLNNRLITYNGQTKNVSQWMEFNGLNHSTFYRRIKNGFSEVEAAVLPKHTKRKQ